MALKIITVMVNLVKVRGKNSYNFVIDTTNKYPSIVKSHESEIRADLIQNGVDTDDIDTALTRYYGGFFAKTVEFFGFPGTGIKTPSPFDVSLSEDGTTQFSDQCYLFYYSLIGNWSFRGKTLTGPMIELKPGNGGVTQPDTYIIKPSDITDDTDRRQYFGVFVSNPLFLENNDYAPAIRGFECDIFMAVQQDNDHETLLVIDPKIRNP